jgi:hypothetical protein
LLAEAEKYSVPCDPTNKLRIRSCQTRIDTAISKARTEALKADTERTRQKNAELIRELQRIIDEKNR